MTDKNLFENMPIEFMFYGTLFGLTNRIQTIGDEFFSDITTKQHLILMTIRLFGDNHPTLKDVADIMRCSYQNIKMIVTALEKKGYLEIKRDAEDKRKFNLVLSEKVKTISTDIDMDIQNFISALYQDLTNEQLTATLTVLEKIDQNLALIERVCHGESN